MNKGILIIANPGAKGADNYCNGVLIDVKNYISYFKSSAGGEWFDDEIKVMQCPSRNEVLEEIRTLNKMDFSIIIFVGHGYSKNNETIIECKESRYDEEEIQEHELKVAGKRLIILDCCRKPVQEAIFGTINENFVHFANSRMPNSTRKEYEKLLAKCDAMNIVGYACSIGETAGDSSVTGGYYSSSILACAKNKFESMDNNKYATFPCIHNLATEIVTKEEPNQNPQINKPRGKERYIPFVIKL